MLRGGSVFRTGTEGTMACTEKDLEAPKVPVGQNRTGKRCASFPRCPGLILSRLPGFIYVIIVNRLEYYRCSRHSVQLL